MFVLPSVDTNCKNLAHRCAKHSLERKGTIVPLLSSFNIFCKVLAFIHNVCILNFYEALITIQWMVKYFNFFIYAQENPKYQSLTLETPYCANLLLLLIRVTHTHKTAPLMDIRRCIDVSGGWQVTIYAAHLWPGTPEWWPSDLIMWRFMLCNDDRNNATG